MALGKQSTHRCRRNSFKSPATLLGLTAGAIGWSSLARANSEETSALLMFLPKHYEQMENGIVVFKLKTGEKLSLTEDQYLILEDGLLLVTEELAQASIYNLSLLENGRVKLLSGLEQLATIDVTLAEATAAQDLSISENQTPRLSEQIEFQSYEIAQSSDNNNEEDEVLPPQGFLWGTGGIVFMAMLNSGGQSESDEQPVEDEAPLVGEAPIIVEADWIALFGRTQAGTPPSSDFDTTGPFLNANSDVMTGSEPHVWPYARATDADGDPLTWSLTGVSSSDYTGYDGDFDSPSELLAEFDIFWNEAGSAYIIWSGELETWYGGSSGVLASDTWTWDIAVSDGSGLTDIASISLDFP